MDWILGESIYRLGALRVRKVINGNERYSEWFMLYSVRSIHRCLRCSQASITGRTDSIQYLSFPSSIYRKHT